MDELLGLRVVPIAEPHRFVSCAIGRFVSGEEMPAAFRSFSPVKAHVNRFLGCSEFRSYRAGRS